MGLRCGFQKPQLMKDEEGGAFVEEEDDDEMETQ
jgi:hypothetical protein